MLGRRSLRIKVMQVLFGYELNKDNALSFLESLLQGSINKSTALYLTNLAYIKAVGEYSMVDAAKRMAKYIQTEEDKKASTLIAANRIVKYLAENKVFNDTCKKEGIHNYIDQEVVKSIFTDLKAKERYKNYCSLSEPDLAADREIIVYLVKKVFAGNKDLNILLDEQFVNFDDDILLLNHVIQKYAEVFDTKEEGAFVTSLQTWETEKKFALDLLRLSYQHDEELIKIIEPNLMNWELERIASLDLVLMKMAVCELKYFPTVPVKVSINEYIDISKLYSTPKSKDFVNGVLDKVKAQLIASGEIKKQGRGLVQ
jgi:N utilization substance protein B